MTGEGIKLRAGRWHHNYYVNERLGELRGERVEVYSNPEMLDHVTVIHRASDPRGVSPFGVPHFGRLAANTATDEDFTKARAALQGFEVLVAPPPQETGDAAPIPRVCSGTSFRSSYIPLRRAQQDTALQHFGSRLASQRDAADTPCNAMSRPRSLSDLRVRISYTARHGVFIFQETSGGGQNGQFSAKNR